MLVYFSMFFSIVLIFIFSLEKNKSPVKIITLNYYFFIFTVSVFFIIGLRYASVDYYSYRDIYNYIVDYSELGFPNYTPSSGEKPIESLYALLTLLIKSMGGTFEVFIFVIATLSVGIKFYAFKKMSNYFYLSVVLYVSNWMVADLGQIRNGLSSALVLLSVYYLYHSRGLVYSIVATSSFLIHVAASLSFLLPFLKILSKRLFLSLILTTFFFMAMLGGFGVDLTLYTADIFGLGSEFRIIRYMDSKYAEPYSITGGTVLMHCLISFCFLLFYDKLTIVNKYNKVLIAMYVYGFSMMLFFIDYGIVFARIKDVFCMPASVVVLPSVVSIFNRKSKPIVILALLCFSFLMFVTTIESAAPYQSIIFE